MDYGVDANEFDIRDIEIYRYRCAHGLRQFNTSLTLVEELKRKYCKTWFEYIHITLDQMYGFAAELKDELDKEDVSEEKIFDMEYKLLKHQKYLLNIMGHIARKTLNPEGFIYSNLSATFERWGKLVNNRGYERLPGETHPIKFSADESEFFKIFMIEDLRVVQDHRSSDVAEYLTHDDNIEHSVRSLSLSNSSTGSFENDDFCPIEEGDFLEFKEHFLKERYGYVEKDGENDEDDDKVQELLGRILG